MLIFSGNCSEILSRTFLWFSWKIPLGHFCFFFLSRSYCSIFCKIYTSHFYQVFAVIIFMKLSWVSLWDMRGLEAKFFFSNFLSKFQEQFVKECLHELIQNFLWESFFLGVSLEISLETTLRISPWVYLEILRRIWKLRRNPLLIFLEIYSEIPLITFLEISSKIPRSIYLGFLCRSCYRIFFCTSYSSGDFAVIIVEKNLQGFLLRCIMDFPLVFWKFQPSPLQKFL